MHLGPTQPLYRAFVDHQQASLPRHTGPQLDSQSPGATSSTLLSPPVKSSMERSAPEYSQSGLPSPYPSAFGDTQSEASSADHGSAATYSSGQEARSANYSTSATPTSEYSVYPPSARSNPSIAAPSPTQYGHSQYSPYGPPSHQDGMQSYPHPQSGGLYAQRPDWANYGQPGHMPHQVFPGTPTSAAPAGRPAQYGAQQVYSFVPIPGAQQHKRPRRRYEEIERMYKCGWNGCEKAYGTLNHLNAHVTMQGHGQKRTPEEFKEIRKEWKARKKEEDAQRKARDEEAQRAQAAVHANGAPAPEGADSAQPPQPYSGSRLPPIGYQHAPSQYPAPPSGGVPQQSLPEYSPTNNMYGGHYQPASPYAPPSQQQMYSQRQ